MSGTTNLREATAEVTAEGILSEKDLKLDYVNGVAQISGTVTIKISDTESITFSARQSAKTKDGKDNKVFPGLETVMKEYKSIAEYGEENADRIRITNGQYRPSFMLKSGREGNFYQSNFFNRINGEEKLDPHADLSVELYVTSITPETYTSGDKQGEETGRAIVRGWLPTYNGIEPVELIAPAEDNIAQEIMSLYASGNTGSFYCSIVNKKIVKTTTTPVRIGKPKVTTSTTYTNELVITGASEPYEDENKAFPADAIKLAISERETRLAEKKANWEAENGNGVKTDKDGFVKPSGRELPW